MPDEILSHEIFKSGLFLDSSVHSIEHWQRVEKYGLMMAEKNGADKEVVSLFACLHDARRESDDHDPEHGERAAVLLLDLIKARVLALSDEQYDKLKLALRLHPITEASSDDITVRTCWDADRLDLWRADIEPDPKYMFTEEGKNPEMIEFARRLNENREESLDK